jgi:hypothetical protein
MDATVYGKGTYINHVSHHLDELILEDDDMAVTREQHLTTGCPWDLKLERRFVAPLEHQIAGRFGGFAVWARLQDNIARDEILRYVFRNQVLRVDPHIQSTLGLIRYFERQVGDIVPVGLAVRASNG